MLKRTKDAKAIVDTDGIAYAPRVVAPGVVVTFAIDPASSDPIGQWLLAEGYPHEAPLQFFRQIVRSSERVIDVGAHIGTFALAAAGAGCSVLAVEGSPDNVRLLRAAQARNRFDHLSVVHAAATDHAGTARFVPQQAWGHLDDNGTASEESIVVDTVTIDGLVEACGWPSVDLVKIDVEGAEPSVLRGMANLLSHPAAPVVLIECNEIRLRDTGSSGVALRAQLADLGFDLYLVDRATPGDLVAIRPTDPQPEAVADIVALRAFHTSRLGPWRLREPFSDAEMLDRLRAAAIAPHALARVHAAETAIALLASPDWLVDGDARLVLEALAADDDPEVIAAARSGLASVEPR